eukprot:GILI01002641.1.p1 GENE.GILI01002641.1~~GILI01002641.1.p1  ORF type:complete len:2337 (+),score=684.12 GILI01002641.1:337-7011(+)
MRSEHTQNDQLCMQSCANVWRKEAFSALTERIGEFKIDVIDKHESEAQHLRTINPILPAASDRVEHKQNAAAVPSGVRHANTNNTRTAGLSDESNTSLGIFREPVIFDVNNTVPKLMLFSEIVENLIESSRSLIRTAEGNSVVDTLLARARREDEVANPAVDVQVVQEQEEERDKEQEEEKEQQVEIEKYVDLAYSRDSETQSSWPMESLGSLNTATQFYPLSSFHLYKRRPIDYPDCIYLSRNFFNPRWSGHRRIRNVIAVIEWVPDANALKIRTAPSCDYGSTSQEESKLSVEKLLEMVRNHDTLIEDTLPPSGESLSKEARTKALLKDIVEMALQRQPAKASDNGIIAPGATLPRMVHEIAGGKGDSDEEWDRVLKQLVSQPDLNTALHETLCSNELRLEEEGRFYVVLSLAEAETLRRITHLRSTEKSLLPSQEAAPTTTISLKGASCSFATLDKAVRHPDPKSNFMPSRTYQCLRFFDCDLHYTEREFGLLLRSIATNPPKARQAFFQQVSGCRRRLRQRWERTPVAGIFILATAFSLLHQRAVGLCARRYFDRAGLNFGDAFLACNSSRSGVLSPAELWGGLRFCKLENLTIEEVVDFIELVDSTHENQIQYGDFLAALTGSKDYEEDQPAADAEVGMGAAVHSEGSMVVSRAQTMEELIFNGENENKNLPEIDPYGADLLKGAMSQRAAQRRAAEAEANAELEEENQRVMDVIEEEEITVELEQMNEKRNPILIPDNGLTFQFQYGSDATNEALYGRDYSEDIEASINKTAVKKKKKMTVDEEEETDDLENNLLSLEEKRELRMKRPMAGHIPAIAKACGNRVRSTLDVDGRSCVTVHSNSALNIPLRVLKRLLNPAQSAPGASKAANLSSFVLSADVRFPNNATVLSVNNDQQLLKPAKKPAGQQPNTANDADTSILAKLQALGASLSFADWMVPMIERKAINDSLITCMFAKSGGEDDELDAAKAAMEQMQQQQVFLGPTITPVVRSADDDKKKKDQIVSFGPDVMKWINKTYFFLEETKSKGNGEGTIKASANPSAEPSDVLLVSQRKGTPSKDVFALRVFREPRPPKTDGDILAVIMDHDFVIATGTKTLNEINEVIFEWIQISSPCAGWIVSRRESIKSKYTGPVGGNATTSALPMLSGTKMIDPTAPIFVPVSAIESKSFVNFFDAIRTRLLMESNGNGLRIEHTRHAYDQNAVRRFVEPFSILPTTVFSPSSQTEVINDRELEIGKAISAKDDGHVGELTGEVNDLLMMIIRAKRLRQGCKVVRNQEHSNAREQLTNVNEVGTVTSVENDSANVRWPGGNTGVYAWGKGGIFELVKVADDDSDEEDELNEDGTVKKYGGGLGGREPVNDERHLSHLKKTSHNCDNCGGKGLIPSNWFRCNHCQDFDLCRKCYKAGIHEEHDFTDLGALQEAENNRQNGKGKDEEGQELAGIFVGATVRVKKDVVAPRFGWGEDLDLALETQQQTKDQDTYHWPSSLAGFIGSVADVDKIAKTVTIHITNYDADNRAKLIKLKEENAGAGQLFGVGGDDEVSETITFMADYTEVEPIRIEEEVVNVVYDSPTAYANLFKMMPHLYHLCSVFEARLATPSACAVPNSTGESKAIPALRTKLAETKINAISAQCPHLHKLAELAAANILGPFEPNQSLVRGQREVVTYISGQATFIDPQQKKRVATLEAIRAKEIQERLLKAQQAAQSSGSDTEEGGSDEEEQEEKPEVVKPEEVIVEVGSELDHDTLFNVNRLPFATRVNAQLPFHIVDWTITTQNTYGNVFLGERPKTFTKQPFKIDALIRFVNFPTEAKPLEVMPSYFKPEHYQVAIGNVQDVSIRQTSTGRHPFLTVRWNVEYEWGGEITNNVLGVDVEEIKSGQWYLRPAADASSVEKGTEDLTDEEKLYFNTFSDGAASLLPSAVNTMLERGLRDGQRLHSVFIRDDNYDVDLQTGEVRRLKPANERSIKIDDDLIDLAAMTPEQRDQVSRLMGTVLRLPAEPFRAKEKPPSVDDGLRHIISLVVQESANGESTTQFVVDGRVAPVQFTGCFSQIRDKAVRTRLLSQAMRLFFHCPISLFGCDFTTASNEAKVLEGPMCSVYYVKLDFDENQERDLLIDTIAWHEGIAASSEWECQECGHANARLVNKCAKCKKARRARVVTEQDSTMKFKVATVASREAIGIRSRLQGKLKAQYQRELDTIDRAQEEMRKTKLEKKAKAEKKDENK